MYTVFFLLQIRKEFEKNADAKIKKNLAKNEIYIVLSVKSVKIVLKYYLFRRAV